jgi:hypothetical protein
MDGKELTDALKAETADCIAENRLGTAALLMAAIAYIECLESLTCARADEVEDALDRAIWGADA